MYREQLVCIFDSNIRRGVQLAVKVPITYKLFNSCFHNKYFSVYFHCIL